MHFRYSILKPYDYLFMQQGSADEGFAFDLAVIGSGPGGYEAALKAAKAGLKVCLIEKGALGGVCVNWGCIPTKALLRSAEIIDLVARSSSFGIMAENVSFDFPQAVKRSRSVVRKLSKGIDFMLQRAGVEVKQGEARFTSPHDLDIVRDGIGVDHIRARSVIIATGSIPREISGLEPDGNRILGSRDALALKTLPSSMIVVGGGAIGIEMAWFYAKAGTVVTLVEMMPRILPLEDAEIALALRRSLEKAGILIYTGAKLERLSSDERGVNCRITVAEEDPIAVHAECLLVAVGVTGNTCELGLSNAGVECSGGYIVTDGECRTSADHVYAIGDVRGGMLLAHKASAEAAIAVASISGKTSEPLDDTKIPRCVYVEPSLASVGLSEEQAVASGFSVRIGRAMFAASGKANAYGNLEGMVKLIFSCKTDRLLGAHVLGHGAVELIGELCLARQLELTARVLAGTVHAHPTLSETIREAAENSLEA
ncbi:dihydrolipoamide dehydrogenase [Chlorobium phaeobacteroides DSM 266]|uniref:Dihydrolipoyl dehydrogenase n=2 Tax=Chlorobium phaeobacteroides TaxID=1096 RepID=A1BGX6_CHLPD|nr:dihydrolipoamide dehydrogenase [Chlorobium phaeobacteroides DSM 266]